jgi:hypothetical protein
VTFPFFDESFLAAPDNDLPLFRRVFKPGIANLAFVGLVQPLGAIMPIAEAQGQWFADALCGHYALPGDDDMRRDIEAERAAMFSRYVKSKRHTMEVDFDDYVGARLEHVELGARDPALQPVREPRRRDQIAAAERDEGRAWIRGSCASTSCAMTGGESIPSRAQGASAPTPAAECADPTTRPRSTVAGSAGVPWPASRRAAPG